MSPLHVISRHRMHKLLDSFCLGDIMPLHPQLPIPERILSVGPAGSGKTTNWLNILRWLIRTHSDTHFYVLDSDFAVPRMLTTYPECVPYITLFNGYEWTDYTSFLKEVSQKARPLQDWVVVDFIGSAWQCVQQYYVEQVFKQEIGDYFLQVRKTLKKDASALGALEGWVDWQVINPLYRKWAQPLLFKGQYHLYCTAKSTPLSSDRKPLEDSQTRILFERYKVKPEGQKTLPFQFHTILLSAFTPRSNARTITTVKDRERQEISGLVVSNFAIDYLKNIASWQVGG